MRKIRSNKSAEKFIEEIDQEVSAAKKKKFTLAERLAACPHPQRKLVDDAQRVCYVEQVEAAMEAHEN